MADGDIATKRCNACQVDKSLTTFYADKTRRDGLCGFCKDCAKDRTGKWYADNPDRAKKTRLDYYIKNRPLALSRMASYRAENSESLSASQKRWRAKNKDRKRSNDKAWQSRNHERVRVFKRVCQHRRRTAIGRSVEHHSSADIALLMKMQRGKCACCRKAMTSGYHIDHIEPLHRGGGNGRHNIQLLCPGCNARKSHKDPISFMQENGFLL